MSRLELFGATTVNVEVPKEEGMEGAPFTVGAAPRGKETKRTFTLHLQQNAIMTLAPRWQENVGEPKSQHHHYDQSSGPGTRLQRV